MRIAIDISETIDGYRLDILEEGRVPYRINPRTKEETFLSVLTFIQNQLKKKPPTHTMEVL